MSENIYLLISRTWRISLATNPKYSSCNETYLLLNISIIEEFLSSYDLDNKIYRTVFNLKLTNVLTIAQPEWFQRWKHRK